MTNTSLTNNRKNTWATSIHVTELPLVLGGCLLITLLAIAAAALTGNIILLILAVLTMLGGVAAVLTITWHMLNESGGSGE
jgi:hypothetical protein